METKQVEAALEALLFASGDPVPAARLAAILELEEAALHTLAAHLEEKYEREARGIRLLRLGDYYQLCSAPEYGEAVTKLLEQRSPPRLSPAAVEVLAIVAYHQPVTRAYIDQIRGMDSAYTVSLLAERGLIELCGRLDVPGRPGLYGTGSLFLRTIGIRSLEELPPLPDLTTQEGVEQLQNAIEALQAAALPESSETAAQR